MLQFNRTIDQQHAIDMLGESCFYQQRNDCDDVAITCIAHCRVNFRQHARPYGRMQYRFKISAAVRVCEYTLTQQSAIQSTGRIGDRLSKSRDDLSERRLPRLDDIARDLIGIHNSCAILAKN